MFEKVELHSLLILLHNVYDYWIQFISSSKFIFPLILSLFSALIFWLVFSYYPTKKRRKQLRPIVEYDIYCVNQGLFSIFDSLFRFNHHSASLFQTDIHSGKLTKKDFYIALQNKCMNETYMYPNEIAQAYLIMGEVLLYRYNQLNETIDKIMNLNEYAYTEELLLLEQIRKNIKTYSLSEKSIKKNAGSVINGREYKGVVSNLAYMHRTIYELYNLYKSLQEIIFIKSSYQNRNILIHKVQFLYYSERFIECKSVINKNNNKYENTELLEHYDILCDYKLKKLDYDKVEKVLKKKHYEGSLVSGREFIGEIIDDSKVLEIVRKHYEESEVNKMFEVLKDEKNTRNVFIESNKLIAKFFEEKDNHLKNINWNE